MLIRWLRLIKIVSFSLLITHNINHFGCSYTNPLSQNPIKSNSLIPFELNIKNKKSNEKYTYKEVNNIGIYEAKEGYGFNKLTINSSCCWLKILCCCFCCGTSSGCSDKEVWETSDAKQYATKVLFDDSNKIVTLSLSDGSTRKYKENSSLGCKSWDEVTQPRKSKDFTINNQSSQSNNQAAGKQQKIRGSVK